MADTPVEIIAPPGLTATAFLYPEGGDALANAGGDAATEATNRKGLYTATVSEALTGWHTLHLVSGSDTIGVWRVLMADDVLTKYAVDRPDGGGSVLLDYDNAIWVDPTNGTDGSTSGTHGKRSNPCRTWANVISLLTTRNLRKVRAIGTGSLIVTSLPSGRLQIEADSTIRMLFDGTYTTPASVELDILGGALVNLGNNIWTFDGLFARLRVVGARYLEGMVIANGANSEFQAQGCNVVSTLALTGWAKQQVTECRAAHASGTFSTISSTSGHCTISKFGGDITLNPTGSGRIHFYGTGSNVTIVGSSGHVDLDGDLRYTNNGTGTLTIDASGVTAKQATQGITDSFSGAAATQIDAIEDGVAGSSTAGAGSRPLEWTILKPDATPATGAEAWISTDSSGATVVAGTFIADDSGIARVPGGTGLPMLDDDVVYYGWLDSAKVLFATNPIQFRYSTANSRWEIWNGTAYVEWT